MDLLRTSENTCVACAFVGLNYFGARNGYTYSRCGHCGTLQLTPLPEKAVLAQAYADTYATAGHCQDTPEVRNRAAGPQFEGLVKTLLAYKKPALVLDCGPGWGGLLDMLRENDISAEGVELSREMADVCEAKGYVIHRSELAGVPEANRYDAILLSCVFEHLVDHADWFKEACRVLKPGGLVVSLQPTAPFATLVATVLRLGITSLTLPQLDQVFWPPWHTVLFSPAGMKALGARHGFELLEVRPAPMQRQQGIIGVIQCMLTAVNKAGTVFLGTRWPLWVGHVFVFQKKR